MTDLIEMNSVVVDTETRELRVGDRVEASWEDGLYGVVTEITRPEGAISQTVEGATVEVAPVVAVKFDNGRKAEFPSQFIRAIAWRWHCMGVKRQ